MKLIDATNDFQLDFIIVDNYNTMKPDCPKTFYGLISEFPDAKGKIIIENNVVYFKGSAVW